jgi:hypothetical protein
MKVKREGTTRVESATTARNLWALAFPSTPWSLIGKMAAAPTPQRGSMSIRTTLRSFEHIGYSSVIQSFR